jgi:hypothetical protein
VHILSQPLCAGDEVKKNHRDLPSYLQISLSLLFRGETCWPGNAPEAVISVFLQNFGFHYVDRT